MTAKMVRLKLEATYMLPQIEESFPGELLGLEEAYLWRQLPSCLTPGAKIELTLKEEEL